MYAHIDTELNEIVQQLPEGREGSITPAQAEFLYHFIRLTQPRIVAETGFNVGLSACVMMRAMETYGGGTLLSFDIGRHDVTHKAAAIVKARFENFNLILGDTKQTLASTLGQTIGSNPSATLDFAFVDGGHDPDTARNDLLICETLLKPGGYLWFDDFENATHICVGVNLVGREFVNTRQRCMRFLTPDHRGMMLYQKTF